MNKAENWKLIWKEIKGSMGVKPGIEKAMAFAAYKHRGQKDDTGKDYFQAHCMHVLFILHEVTEDIEMLQAALLHDTIEDTDTTHEEIKKVFGKRVADLVYEVTHEGDAKTSYYFPRLKSKDAILIKFADRMSNLSRMNSWSKKRQQQYLNKSKFWRSE